ncbi:tyrosine-type recombinase/integrase [Chryseobacterium lathyri]|uniref:Integrase n=1 Tax=Chryseobacterium lathyri TaxID=395933 RepID=A0ABT9SPS6_9FLAO|nr:tyrosine-type recombinase/integrase [Chryseobacterium lathyri]MDP9961273.1 integrase [Chryseobacterium lathyri]
MATVKFILQSKNENAPIYVRLSVSAKESFKRKSRETINPEDWNFKKGFPRNISVGTESFLTAIEETKNNLSELESFIYKEFQKRTDNDLINGIWLDEVITAYYNGGNKTQQLDFLDNYLNYYLSDVLPFRKNRGKEITLSTIKKQKTIIFKIQDFLKSLNKRLRVSDYDVKISNKFESFLESQGISKNTIGRYIKYPKTIISHATELGIHVSSNLSSIKGYTTETPTIYITELELKKISQITFLNTLQETAKDWLIIGFYTGQRASDLLQMNNKQLIEIDGNLFINLSQVKTKHPVLIPVHDEVKKVLRKRDNNFPNKFSDNIESAKTMFNTQLRKITKLAEINRLEWGKKYDKENKKYIYGDYPLYDIISSHVCRRSFATHNYAKMPTPIIMAVTGHKTEKEFLNYIGKDFNDLSKQMFDYWKQGTQDNNVQPHLSTSSL